MPTMAWTRCLFLVLILLSSKCLGFEKFYDGNVVFQVTPNNTMQIDALKKMSNELKFEFDFWKNIGRIGRSTEIMVPPEKIADVYKYFKQNHITEKILIADVGKLVREAQKMLVSEENFPKQMAYIKGVAQQYANFVQLGSLGNSTEKRDTRFLKIGYPSDKPKKILFIDAGIHAREWLAHTVALCTIDRLVTNPDYASLLYGIDIYIVPNVNPDGYEYSRTKDLMWRKNRSGPRNGNIGVDLNRNFAFKWGFSGVTNDTSKEDFGGPSPFSEVEAKNLAKILNDNKNLIKGYITLHSYAQSFLYPWGYATGEYPPDVKDLIKVANDATAAIRNVHGTQYTVESSADLYPASGASDDYSKSIGVKYVYTIELSPLDAATGQIGFQPPKERIQSTCEEMFSGILVVAKAVQTC